MDLHLRIALDEMTSPAERSIGVAIAAPASRLNIWLITVGEPLPLPGSTARLWRTGLLANVLSERGHKVTWWTSTVDHFTKEYFAQSDASLWLANGVELQFLHGELYRRNISLARFRNHRQIARAFRRLAALRERPHLILCSFPTIELSFEAVAYGRERGVPVLLDIRDLWPDEMEARVPRFAAPMLRLALASMYRQTRYALANATGLIAVSQEYLNWGLRKAGREARPADVVHVHGYPTPAPLDSADEAQRTLVSLGIDPSRKLACYIGTFVGSRDFETLLNAAERLADRTDLQFVLAGSGEQEAALHERARGMDNVVLTGWVNQQQLATIAWSAWVGLGPYKRGTRVSLTNKIFEYLAYGLPVVLCLPGEAQELLEKAGCGVAYEPGSAESLELAIRQMLNEPARHAGMSQRARKVFQENYSSQSVYAHLARDLEEMACTAPAPTEPRRPMVELCVKTHSS